MRVCCCKGHAEISDVLWCNGFDYLSLWGEIVGNISTECGYFSYICTHTHTHIYIYIYIYTHTHTYSGDTLWKLVEVFRDWTVSILSRHYNKCTNMEAESQDVIGYLWRLILYSSWWILIHRSQCLLAASDFQMFKITLWRLGVTQLMTGSL